MAQKSQNQIKQSNYEPLVDLPEVMKVYGNKKTFWNEAKNFKGLPSYDLGKIKFRLSEVEQWVQQRRRIGTV